MLIFLAIVMGPGLGFMLFALSQFWLEATRFRHADPRRLPVTVVTATDPWGGTQDERAPRWEAETSGDDRSAREEVVTTHLGNRVAKGSF
jgi:hypothetical protein